MKINTLLVILAVLTPPALQAETPFDVINAILATERIFTVTFVLLLIFLGKQVWPWYSKRYEAKQQMDYDFRMAQLTSEERQEERQEAVLERVIKSNAEIRETLLEVRSHVDILVNQRMKDE